MLLPPAAATDGRRRGVTVQNAKDSFYVALRDRLTSLSPTRTVVIRDAVRPAILAAENELEGCKNNLLDAFVLDWKEIEIDSSEPLPLLTMSCVVRYRTRGTSELSGLDRGRVLTEMDSELSSILEPRFAVKKNFVMAPAIATRTNLFWSAPEFGALTSASGQLAREVALKIFALQEDGH